ncbi:MAG: hypothetical protein ACP6IY_19355 [Promethearchaeia archaeon]
MNIEVGNKYLVLKLKKKVDLSKLNRNLIRMRVLLGQFVEWKDLVSTLIQSEIEES